MSQQSLKNITWYRPVGCCRLVQCLQGSVETHLFNWCDSSQKNDSWMFLFWETVYVNTCMAVKKSPVLEFQKHHSLTALKPRKLPSSESWLIQEKVWLTPKSIKKSPNIWVLLKVVVDGKSRFVRPGAAVGARVSPHCLSPVVPASLSLTDYIMSWHAD